MGKGFLFFLLLFLAECIFLEAVTGSSRDKVYIAKEQIILGETTLLFKIRGKWIPVEAVYSDGRGLYIAPNSFCYPGQKWHCLECGFLNAAWSSPCVDCQGIRK